MAPIVEEGKSKRDVYFPGTNEEWHSFRVDIKTGKPDLSESSFFKGGKKVAIENSLPSAAPTFLRAGYALLLNEPTNRSAKLTNKFHLLAALKDGKATTRILAINDYENDQHITTCLSEGCFLEVAITQKGDFFEVSWKYKGSESVRGSVEIQSLTVVSGSQKWTYEGLVGLVGERSKTVQM